MSVSRNNNNIKIWEIKYFKCLVNIKAVNSDGLLNSSAFLNYNNNIYITPFLMISKKMKYIEFIKKNLKIIFFIIV